METATQSGVVSLTQAQREVVDALLRLRAFGDATEPELAQLAVAASEERLEPGAVLALQDDEPMNEFLILLHGELRISRGTQQGEHFIKKVQAPSFMGELSLLSNVRNYMTARALTDIHFLRLNGDAFWTIMAECPGIRRAILAEASLRTRGMQAFASQQEKLALLGTMTAGLMHELNNPGAAARRAAQQLRANLQHMHTLERSFSERGHTAEQRACLTALQERVLRVSTDVCMSSLQQSDAEEELGTWMHSYGIADAWKLAPTLVASGFTTADLACLARVFHGPELAEPLEWLEATASSMQMVGLVEESVARVVELAQAVKSYAHEGQGGVQNLDVNESVHGTLVLLKHKFREKGIVVEKDFAKAMPLVECACSGLNQIWTNLLDNAIDAVSPGGHICVKTFYGDGELHVSIRDDGPGIAPEDRERIFDPFYTTKPAGVGTGLGLGIVKRILESYNGRLTVDSRPGSTEFVVHIPEHIH